MDNLTINERKQDNYTLLDVTGTINSYTYTAFQEKVYKIIEKDNLVIDMSKVTNLSSAGIGVLMAALEVGENNNKKLFILSPSEVVLLAINSTGFGDQFKVIKSLSELELK